MSHNSKCYTKKLTKKDAKDVQKINTLFKRMASTTSESATRETTDIETSSDDIGFANDIK